MCSGGPYHLMIQFWLMILYTLQKYEEAAEIKMVGFP